MDLESVREAAGALVGAPQDEIADALVYMFRGGYNAGAAKMAGKLSKALADIQADLEKAIPDPDEQDTQ